MLNEKKISKSGSITIPSHLRREMGLIAGEKVKIEQDKEGNFSIKRIEGSCIMCKSNENLIKLQGIFVCETCAENIKKNYEARQER
ncbi:MAG: AbrB/MazE/SpoVT family DNA-binding domain-containing protein [Eubacteriales bacterium]|nr:AbrB/MazE/SpoVT family DNA-binding domain-containing protein [Eubacteriales bacterium]